MNQLESRAYKSVNSLLKQRQFIFLVIKLQAMKERKVWNSEEDRILKLLIEERGMTKWAHISQVMQKQFSIEGRNGKQCRQRYHNHLDKNISNEEWTHQEENTLFGMQDQYGNKWALIASHLPGRSDNCVKNHFYSKLRKGLRKVNKKINKHLKKQYKDIKTSTLYKVIETMENRNKGNANIEQETVEICRKIKNRLREYDDTSTTFQDQNDELVYLRVIIEDLAFFDRDIKKNSKKGSLKSSLVQEQPNSPLRIRISAKLSTKSVYDGEDSQYSESDLFSSSSFDHRSFCSMRSNRSQNKSSTKEHLKPEVDLYRSQSIASESQNDSDPQNLCKSANSYAHYNKTKSSKRAQLTNSLSLPQAAMGLGLRNNWHASNSMKLPSPDFTSKIDKQQLQIKKEESQNLSSNSNKQKSKHSNQAQNQNQIFYTYMMGEEPFQMRLFSPKKLTVQQKIQMDNQDDDLFYGQNMQVESQGLIQNMNGLTISDIPTLSRNRDL